MMVSRWLSVLGLCRVAWVLVATFALIALLSPVQADITDCNVSSTGIVFSEYDLVNKAAVANSGELDVTCTGTGSGANNIVTVDLSTGSGSCVTRTLQNGEDVLAYNIYTTPGHSTAWCAPITQSHAFAFGASPQTHTFTLSGLVASGQNVPPGTFSDSLVASLSWPGGAGTTGAVPVTQSAPASCSVSATTLEFGTYSGVSTNATASLEIICSMESAYSVALGAGNNLDGTLRRMAGPSSSFVGYSLFSDPAHTSAWGDGSALGVTAGGTGSGTSQSLTVYGQTSAGPMPIPGSYTDTVVVTLTY